MNYSDNIVNNCVTKNECVWPNCQCCSSIIDWTDKLASRQKDIEPDVQKIVNKHFLDMLPGEQSGNSGELDYPDIPHPHHKAKVVATYKLQSDELPSHEEIKPDWEKEGHVSEAFYDHEIAARGIQYCYEKYVKPLQELYNVKIEKADGLCKQLDEKDKEIDLLQDELKMYKQTNSDLIEDQQPLYETIKKYLFEIEALKEEKEHFRKLYIEKLNELVGIRAQQPTSE